MTDLEFQKVIEEVKELIAEHELRNSHYIRDDEIVASLSCYKKKDVKRAIKEVR